MEFVRVAALYRGNDRRAALLGRPTRPLTIKDDAVTFLLDALREQSDFRVVMIDAETSIWLLDFFIDSPFRQTIVIDFAQQREGDFTSQQSYQPLTERCQEQALELFGQRKSLAKGVFAQIAERPDEANMQLVSLLVRDTRSLRLAELIEHSDRFLHVDGRGCVTISHKSYHQVTFERQLLLLALAKAYLLAINDISTQLARCCEDVKPLKQLYKAAVNFNARFFFAFPVKVNRYSTFRLWESIREAMAIECINDELTQQLQSVHHILTEEEVQHQLVNELRLNKRLGWLGIAIGVLSLVSLFEITPEKMGDFFQSWISFFHH